VLLICIQASGEIVPALFAEPRLLKTPFPAKQEFSPAESKPAIIMTNDEALAIFKDSGALLEGHFLLASGYHSGSYLEKFQVLQYPKHVERMCAEIARRFAGANVELVIGPTTGGMLLAYEVAKHLGIRGIFAERGDDGKGRVLRRGFTVSPSERILVVDDILSTGGSVRDTIDVVNEWGGTLVGVGVLADRSGGTVDFGVPLEALLTLDIEKFAPDALPDWLAAIPLTERGSSHLLKSAT
jgi:orotate phosphoribosyltransferase